MGDSLSYLDNLLLKYSTCSKAPYSIPWSNELTIKYGLGDFGMDFGREK